MTERQLYLGGDLSVCFFRNHLDYLLDRIRRVGMFVGCDAGLARELAREYALMKFEIANASLRPELEAFDSNTIEASRWCLAYNYSLAGRWEQLSEELKLESGDYLKRPSGIDSQTGRSLDYLARVIMSPLTSD